MIDVIVLDYGKDLIKTLSSIYIQTISDKVNVYIIGKDKFKDMDGFKDRLNIKEYYGSLNKMKKRALLESNGDFIYTMYSGDVFYDVFSLNNVYKIIDKYDAVIGNIVNGISSVNFIDRGNLYRRSYLIDNNILDLNYEKMFLMKNRNYIYCNDLIYVSNSNLKINDIIKDTIRSIDEAYIRGYSIELISNYLYDVLMYISYYKDGKKINIDELYKYYERYGEYSSLEFRTFYSNLYGYDVENGSKIIQSMVCKKV